MYSWSTLSSGCSWSSRTLTPVSSFFSRSRSAPHLQLLLNATDDVTPDASEVHVNARIAKIDLAINAQSRISMDWSTTWTQYKHYTHRSAWLTRRTESLGGWHPLFRTGPDLIPFPYSCPSPTMFPSSVLEFPHSPHLREGQTSLPSLSRSPFKVQTNVEGI
jgi:hypothetical protein